MENWLGEQINQIASQWAGAIKQHYPEAYREIQIALINLIYLPTTFKSPTTEGSQPARDSADPEAHFIPP